MSRNRQVKLSKFLSYVLRHGPQSVGVQLDAAGWVDVDALLAGMARGGRSVSRDELEKVVATNDKQRFELSPDGTRIRASQGHSVDVDLQYEAAPPPDYLYHGTADRNLASICQEGLRKGTRHHVHLSGDVETALAVGRRYGTPVVLRIESGRMWRDGYMFYESTNGVWLTEEVPPKYLEQER